MVPVYKYDNDFPFTSNAGIELGRGRSAMDRPLFFLLSVVRNGAMVSMGSLAGEYHQNRPEHDFKVKAD